MKYLQTVKKVFWNSGESGGVTMVDDVPTESRLWPKGWKISRLEEVK